jgi:hypothetical protein
MKNMEEDILKRIIELEIKTDKMYKSVEQMRKIFLWTFILNIVFIILPIIGLLIVIPMFWNSITSAGF